MKCPPEAILITFIRALRRRPLAPRTQPIDMAAAIHAHRAAGMRAQSIYRINNVFNRVNDK